ncbi:hypothetical protein BT96DRAFT_813783, partial [Gymnopus androsaceus JB14]
PDGVVATGTMGTTNPPEATMGTSINQTSDARLLTINSIDDWCIFAPPEVANISDSETFEVAWCTQARNNARVIPDGTITGVSLLKTDSYVQIMGYGNLTRLNIPNGDFGGELDPHGATGAGNPVGGNVTTNMTVDGQTINVAEWMLYVDYNQFCFRACTWANETYSAAAMCWHELDEMGCEFVMPGNYEFNNTFETCEADVAYPPGKYPPQTLLKMKLTSEALGWYVEGVSDGTTSFSSFAQYWTGVVNGATFTVGDLVTPSTVQSIPSSSNCVTTSTISNGIDLASLGITGVSGTATGSASGATGSSSSGSGSSGSGSSSSTSGGSSSGAERVVRTGMVECITLISMISAIAAIGLFH